MNEAETRAEHIDPSSKAAGWGVAEGEKTHRSVDLLGRVYEYFLTRFASAEGKNGGQFYTPSCVVRCLVDPVPVRKDLAPYKGRIYDPACGSGGMFVQSEKFGESHGGTAMRDSAKPISEASPQEFREAKHHRGDNSWPSARTYGQESNATTRRLAIMNLAIRGIEADIGKEHADTFRNVQHPDLRADTATRVSSIPKPRSHSAGLLRSERQLLANPPFNDSDTALRGGARYDCEAHPQVVRGAKDSWSKDDDVRWQFGVPPMGNANFAWVQHFIVMRSVRCTI